MSSVAQAPTTMDAAAPTDLLLRTDLHHLMAAVVAVASRRRHSRQSCS